MSETWADAQFDTLEAAYDEMPISAKKRIAELEAEIRAHERGMREAWEEYEKRDELIRDMWEDIVGLQGGYEELGYQTSLPEFAKRMRRLGIEVGE